MHRARTILFFWRKDVFKGIPLLDPCKQRPIFAEDYIKNHVKYGGPMDKYVDGQENYPYNPFLKNTMNGKTVVESIVIKDLDFECLKDIHMSSYKNVASVKEKIANRKRYFDKSAIRQKLDRPFPSLTSMAKFIHPTEDRMLYGSEYAQLMGYPHDFEFYQESKVPVVQAIAQGVPAYFVKYFCEQAIAALEGKLKLIEGYDAVFQAHVQESYVEFDIDNFIRIEKFGHKEMKDAGFEPGKTMIYYDHSADYLNYIDNKKK